MNTENVGIAPFPATRGPPSHGDAARFSPCPGARLEEAARFLSRIVFVTLHLEALFQACPPKLFTHVIMNCCTCGGSVGSITLKDEDETMDS